MLIRFTSSIHAARPLLDSRPHLTEQKVLTKSGLLAFELSFWILKINTVFCPASLHLAGDSVTAALLDITSSRLLQPSGSLLPSTRERLARRCDRSLGASSGFDLIDHRRRR